jgi:hypothetical protein
VADLRTRLGRRCSGGGREGASDVVVAKKAATGDARHDGGCEMTRRREKRGDVPERMEEKRTAR